MINKPISQKSFSVDRFLKYLLFLFLLSLIASILILSAVPPVSRDALTHHLAVPKLYLIHGGIYKIPTLPFSFYPMNLELLYMIPLYFGYDIIPKFIHFFFGLMTAALLFSYLKKRINTPYGLLGALFFLSIPIVVKLSITIYVDLGLIFFSTASLICLLSWIESGFKFKYVMLSAISCGLALGTKYNGLIVWFLLTLFIPFFYSRIQGGGVFNSSKALGYAAVFMIISLLVFSPWMIRNYVWTKNPIYPLYQNWFQPKKKNSIFTAEVRPESSQSVKAGIKNKKSFDYLGHFAQRSIIYDETWLELGLIPLRIFFQGEDDNPKYFDGKLNPFLLLLPFFAFWGQRKDQAVIRREKWILLSFAVFFLAFAFFKTDMRIRYIAPIIPPLVILSVFGLNRMKTIISERGSRYADNLSKFWVVTLTIIYLSLTAFYVMDQFKYVNPLSYLSGRKSREAYIEEYRREFPVFQYANKNLPANAKILRFFLGNRIYFSDRETIAGRDSFYSLTKKAEMPDHILFGLRKIGITHLIIRHDLFDKWLHDNFNDKEMRILVEFFKEHARLLFFKNEYGLYAI